jgi:hypothetical protein
MPKMIHGEYINPQYGLELTLPSGVQGMETTNIRSTVITITLGDLSTAKIVNGMNDLPLVEVSMNPPLANNLNGINSFTGSNSSANPAQANEEMGCKTLLTTNSNVGGKGAQVFEKDCIVGAGSLVKLKKFNIDLEDQGNVVISFRTPSLPQYAANIGMFDDIVKSIRFTK